MPVYRAPGQEQPRNLVAAMTAVPASERLSPLERQLTEILAWCLARSDDLAREVASAFVKGDEEAESALAASTRFRIDTEVPLSADFGYVRPDLSLCGEERRFQLLVEVKFDSEFHSYGHDGRRVLQPDYYAEMWRTRDPAPADVCRVGTLTRSGGTPEGSDPWRCRDLSWQAIRDILLRHSEDRTVGGVALDVARFLDDLERTGIGVDEAKAFLDEWRPFVRRAVDAVAKRLDADSVSSRLGRGRDHPVVGGFFRVSVGGKDVSFWLHLSPADTRYAVVGAPDAFHLVANESTGRYPPEALPSLLGSFDWNRDHRGHWCFRRSIAVDDLLLFDEADRLDLLLDALAAPIEAGGPT